MASNYFEMGRALTGSYHAGLGMYKDRQLREEEAARQAEAHRIQMENARRQQRIAQETDDAFAAYNTLNTQGVVQAPGTGLSVPSAQAIAGGELSGLGSGERGIRDTAGMYQREMGRYPPPPRATPAPGAAPAPAGLPRYDAQAPVDFRPATELEQEQALGRISAAQRDVGGLRASTERQTKLKFDAGYKKYADTLITDMRELGPRAFIEKHGKALNANGKVDGYMTFDEKTGQIAVATKAGVEMMDPADVLAYQLGAYKLGNGKVEEGIALMTGASDRNSKRIADALSAGRDVLRTQVSAWKARHDVRQGDARLGIERDRADAYKQSLGTKGAFDGFPPEVASQLRAMNVAIAEETDPAKRAALEAQFARAYNIEAAKVGRLLPGSGGRGAGVSQKDVADAAIKLVENGSAKNITEADFMARQLYGLPVPDLRSTAAERARNENTGADGNAAAGITPPAAPARGLVPPAPSVTSRQQARAAAEAAEVETTAALRRQWQELAPTINLDALTPQQAREYVRQYRSVMDSADLAAIWRIAGRAQWLVGPGVR